MTKVFLLHHVRELEDDASEVKLIGAYSSEEKANAAIARLADQPGFRDYPDGFECEPLEIDQDGWVEGFVTDEILP